MRLTTAAIGVCTAMMLLSLAACGGDDDDSTNANGAAQNGSANPGQCDEDGCFSCLSNGGAASCADECSGCDDQGMGPGAEAGQSASNAQAGASGSNKPEPECSMDHDCGISFECLACGLNDSEGFCVQTQECHFDSDCGAGGKCGYKVETSDYRCLPAEYCD